MSNKRLKFVRKKVQAGFSDSALAPDLIPDQNEKRISSPSENLQRLSPQEATMLQNIAGNPNVVSLDENGEHYINPAHLKPEFEALLNRQRMNRDIPNNGPFYAKNSNELVKYAKELETENKTLVKLCKTLIQHKQQLVRERVNLITEREQSKQQRVYAEKLEKVSKVVQLMQRKGLVSNSEKAFAQKVQELLSTDDNSLLSIINLVRSVPENNTRLASRKYTQEDDSDIPETSPIFIPDKSNTTSLKHQLQSKFESFPWSGTVSHR